MSQRWQFAFLIHVLVVSAVRADNWPAWRVYLGLGDAKQFDLRVTFPGPQTREWHSVEVKDRLQVTPEGIKESPSAEKGMK